MTLVAWAAMVTVTCVAAYAQATVGIGFAMIAAPALLLLAPGTGPTVVLLAMLALAAVMAWRDRDALDLRSLAVLMPGLAIGAALAIGAEPWLSATRDRIVGAVVLAAAAVVASGLQVPTGRGATFVLGGVAGLLGTVSGVHGPALAMLYAGAPRKVMRATIAVAFVAACVISLVALRLGDQFDMADIRIGTALLPAVALGWLLGQISWLVPPERALRTVALLLVAAGGATLLIVG